MRPINSDQLGKMGEQRFGELCAASGLICNKSDWDRTGWDYIIEFPFALPTAQQPLDRRPQPPECRSQVKTVWSGGRNFKLRLSSAERLAKFLQSTSIFVLTVDGRLNFEALYGIHIIDDVLAYILKAVRECQAVDSTRINKTLISFNFLKVGRQIELSTHGIKSYLEDICGNDPESYIKRKSDQILNLGVVGNRFSGRFTIEARDKSEMADILIGTKKGKVVSFSTVETRFGITLPHDEGLAGQILIRPKPHPGQATFRCSATKEAVTIKVAIVVPPFQNNSRNAETDQLRVRIFNEFIELIFERSDGKYTVSSTSDGLRDLKLSEYITLNKIQRIVSGGAGSMELREGKNRLFVWPFDTVTSEHSLESFTYARDVLLQIRDIVDAAGGSEILLATRQINDQIAMIEFVYHLLKDEPGSVTITPLQVKPIGQFPPDLLEVEGLVLGRLLFSNAAVAFCAIATIRVTDDPPLKKLEIGPLSIRQLDIIELDAQSFDHFDREMQAQTGLSMVLKLGEPTAISAEASELR